MKIGIIGAGNVGTGIGGHLAAKGHTVVVSFARTPDKVSAAAQAIGGDTKAGSPEAAAAHGDVVIVATPWGITLDTVRPLAASLAGRIIWDTTNPFAPDMSELLLGTTTSAGEELAKAVPGAKVVKAVPPSPNCCTRLP
jgi:predicted dinucleotide-binding enzyme